MFLQKNHSMDFNLTLPLLLLVALLILFFSPTFTSQTFPIAKPRCEDRCGNVSIPFPFGTKEGCYLNKQFFINCTNSSNNVPQPVLMNTTINVTDIYLEGQMRLLHFVGRDCYLRNGSSNNKNSPLMYLPKPFSLNNTANKFTVIGCDTYSFVKGFNVEGREYTTGCMSICTNKSDLIEGSCSGIGCCQTSIASRTWNFNVTLRSYYNHSGVWDFNPCSYAFLVEDRAFRFSVDNLTNLDNVISLPLIVDWTIEYATCEAARKNSTSYACSTNSLCYEPANGNGYRCKCKDGYKGNPYLPDGCQDINECLDSSRNKCPKHSVCFNTLGNYTCNCSKGYHNDGGDGVEYCIPRTNRNGKLIWSVTGVAISTALILALSFCWYCEWKRRKENRLKEDFFRKNGGLILQQRLTKQGGDSTNTARIFTVEELQKATNNFDESKIVGQGGFGTVFKGILADKRIVAIKKSKGVDLHQVEQFINEVIVLSQINNRNVVKLLGCCLETEAPLLVYEFINNGTLSDHLHKFRAPNLTWSIRLRIASEVAGVLSYLHSTASPPIIHRDIKSVNILLDHNYTAKVSDFGLSKLVPSDENQVSTVVQGTHGYLDPEYLQTGLLTEKSDVYSYGVVLVELLTGKKALSSERPEAERFLSNYFISSIKEENLIQILDSKILCNENTEQVKKVAMIAKWCLSVKGEDRPSMKDVARELEGLEIRFEQFPRHVVERDFTESEALISLQSKIYVNSDDSSCLYVGSDTTREHMMLPVDGGR